jgi:hypothetical protein
MIFDILLVVIGLVAGYIFKAKINSGLLYAEREAAGLRAQISIVQAHAKTIIDKADADFKAEYQKLHDIISKIF